MLRLIALNPTVLKRMPPKQAGGRPRNIRKMMKTLASLVNSIEKSSTSSQPQESMRLLEGKDRLRVLYLIRQIIKMPDLPSNITLRLLKVCVHLSSPSVCRQVLNTQNVDLRNLEGGELLLDAVAENQEDISAILMRRGADLSDRKSDNDSRSILHEVLRSRRIKTDSKREELVRLILDCGADVNACDNSGYSLLHYAILYNHCSLELVEELLQRGAKLTINESCSGLNDIYLAAMYKLEILPRLIEHQVPDDETRNQRRVMAIDYLLSKEHDEAKTVDTMHIVEKILDFGGPIDAAKNNCRVEKCEKLKKENELEKMKEEIVYRGVSYFSLLSRSMYGMLQLMKNQNFVNNFKQDEKRRAELFPIYCNTLLHCFEVAEKRLEMLLVEKNVLQNAFGVFLPDHIAENIAYYLCYEKLIHCQHDYYMDLHATLKNVIVNNKVKNL